MSPRGSVGGGGRCTTSARVGRTGYGVGRGSGNDSLGTPDSRIVIPPPSSYICGRGPIYYRGGGSCATSHRCTAASTIGSSRSLPDGTSPFTSTSSHWSTQPTSRSQSSRRGAFLTPYTNIGGRVTVVYRQHPTDGPSMLSASLPPWSPSSTSSAQLVL